jgi:hypothetical protein
VFLVVAKSKLDQNTKFDQICSLGWLKSRDSSDLSKVLAMLEVGSSDIKSNDTWGISSAPQLTIYAKRQ